MSPPSGVIQLKQVKTNESPNKINYKTHISYNWIFYINHLYITITQNMNDVAFIVVPFQFVSPEVPQNRSSFRWENDFTSISPI